MKYIITGLLFACIIMQAQAQDSTREQTIKNLIDTKHYTFEPTTMTTGGGRFRQLTPGYFFQVKNDTLKVELPYVGRAYNAPIDPSDAGFDFITTDFTYTVSTGKKNSYSVSVKTKGKPYNTEFALTVFDNGTAYLRANATDKQPVSYNGNIK